VDYAAAAGVAGENRRGRAGGGDECVAEAGGGGVEGV